MWSVLRRAGGDAMVGLLGVTVAMLSIGLSFVALQDDKDLTVLEIEITVLSLIPFSIAGIFLLLFIGTWVHLSGHAARTRKRITGVQGHISSGLKLRNDVLKSIITGDEIEQSRENWHAGVMLWMKSEEPDYLLDFELAAPGVTFSFAGGIGTKAHTVVQTIDASLGALRELLSDLRARL